MDGLCIDDIHIFFIDDYPILGSHLLIPKKEKDDSNSDDKEEEEDPEISSL